MNCREYMTPNLLARRPANAAQASTIRSTTCDLQRLPSSLHDESWGAEDREPEGSDMQDQEVFTSAAYRISRRAAIARVRRHLNRVEKRPQPRSGRRWVSWNDLLAWRQSEVRHHTPEDGWQLRTIGTPDSPSYIAVDRRTGRFVREWDSCADLVAYFRVLATYERLGA